MTVMFDERPQVIDDKTRVSMPVMVQIIAWVIGLMVIYGAVNARVSVVETQQQATKERIDQVQHQFERLERKIDILLERVK